MQQLLFSGHKILYYFCFFPVSVKAGKEVNPVPSGVARE
jgi:hypothetical protein